MPIHELIICCTSHHLQQTSVTPQRAPKFRPVLCISIKYFPFSVHYFFTSLEVILMDYSGYSQGLPAFIHLQIMQAHCIYMYLPASKLSEIQSAWSDRLCAHTCIIDVLKNNK